MTQPVQAGESKTEVYNLWDQRKKDEKVKGTGPSPLQAIKEKSQDIFNQFEQQSIGRDISNGVIHKKDMEEIKKLLATGNYQKGINYINLIIKLYKLAKDNNIASEKDRGIIKKEFADNLSQLTISQLDEMADYDL